MKAILIATAALMTGAGVYGLVDYNKTSGTTDFERLYKEEKSVAPAAVTEGKTDPGVKAKETKAALKTTVPEKKEVKGKTNAVKSVKKKKKLSYKLFSRSEPREVIVEK